MATTKFSTIISVLKCDNGRQCIPEKLIQFSEEKGI